MAAISEPDLDRPRNAADWIGALAAACLGFVVVQAIYGASILPPSHTGWMLSGRIGPDPVQYWLGWTAFRQDVWHWPPGANPGWGMELGSSIFFADAIPILAFAFKALRPVVEVDQYWGLWIHACGALQGLMAWALLGRATRDPLARLAGVGLFVLQPLLLARLGGHFALGGQFLILAGLWLCVVPGQGLRRALAWAGLILIASLVQAYLLAMVGGLWATDWLARAIRAGRPGLLASGAEAAAVPAAALAGLWAAGFFLLQGGFGGTWGGYGQMQLDLLALFDPGEWGGILPDIETAGHLDAGSSYPGLGVLFVLGGGLLAWLSGRGGRLRGRGVLLLGLTALLAFAISHSVLLGGHEVLAIPLPEAAVARADALRASERFVWPVLYAALFAACAALARALGGRRAGYVLAVALLFQAVDLRPGAARLHDFFVPQPPTLPLRLAHPFWTEAAQRYDAVRVVPTGMQAMHWEEIAVYAATRGLMTDAVYLARIDPRVVQTVNASIRQKLLLGAHEPGTFYVLGDETALTHAWAGMDPASDLLDRFDGIWVLAPGWRDQTVANSATR